MNAKIKVSIVTPSFNQGFFLEETILSVLNQTYENIEYIIVDGGSTDNSIDIIKKYENNINYWISEKDNGQAHAINKGFARVTGDYICWLNSDDLLYPNFVAERVKQFNKNPEVDFIYGDVEQGKNCNKRQIRKGAVTDFKTMLISLKIPIPQQSAMWRRKVIEEIGYLDEKWHVLLDREYFMRIALNSKMLYIPGAVAFFRNHDQSKSIAAWRKWADELEIYYQQLFSDAEINKKFGKYKYKAEAAMFYECAAICRDCKDESNAKNYINKAYKSNFLFILYKIGMQKLYDLKRRLIFI